MRRTKRSLNTGFVVRGLFLALPLAIAVTLIAWLGPLAGPRPGPTPPPPTILAPRGELPAGPVVWPAWARHRGEGDRLVGNGFLLRLPGGQVAGVTTAHSFTFGDPDHPLEQIVFGRGEPGGTAIVFDTLRGPPGRARSGADATVDYVLLEPGQPFAGDVVLTPDPRGAPQPGERVWLVTARGARRLAGTVQSVEDRAVWVLMDGVFNPALMSGSPVVSQHTGQAVGMLVAGTLRGGRWLLALHPVGSLVALAEGATTFPGIADVH